MVMMVYSVTMTVLRLMLPINSLNKPDYEYMEQYAKNMMRRKHQQYLDYLPPVKKKQETEYPEGV